MNGPSGGPALSFRPGTRKDFPTLTAIWKAAVESTHDFISADEIAGYEARMPAEFLPGTKLTVALADGVPVGFIGMTGDEVDMLFVKPEFHGQGIGRELISRNGAAKRELRVDVSEQNPGGLAFYRRLGFEPTGRSATDSDGNPHPLVHLTLRKQANPSQRRSL